MSLYPFQSVQKLRIFGKDEKKSEMYKIFLLNLSTKVLNARVADAIRLPIYSRVCALVIPACVLLLFPRVRTCY